MPPLWLPPSDCSRSCTPSIPGTAHRLKGTRIAFEMPRVACHNCGVTRQVAVSFPTRRSLPPYLERYALELSRHMTIQDVAHHLGVSWDTIKDIQKRDLQQHYSKPRLRHLKQIAIDKISVARGTAT